MPREKWPNSLTTFPGTQEELRKGTVLVSATEARFVNRLLEKYSSLNKLQRVVSFMLRFSHNARSQCQRVGPLSFSEIQTAVLIIIKAVQAQVFAHEIAIITRKGLLSKPFRKLSLFLDDNNILRVGGRLTHANLSFSQEHPILLPGKHRLTELLIDHFHQKY